MTRPSVAHCRQAGSSLIEVLVTLVILTLGLLGLVGLMVQSQRSQLESYQRVQALMMLDDMANRINTNRKAAACYAITTDATTGTPYLGTGSSTTPTCATGTAQQQARAVQDLTDWSNLLLGSTETAAGANAGGMLGARGCVQLVAPNVYQISVVWQGSGKTFAPAGVSCATGSYGDDAQRRGVSVTLQIASLS